MASAAAARQRPTLLEASAPSSEARDLAVDGETSNGLSFDGVAVERVTVQRALSVPTRAGIYRRLRTEATPATAREVAEMFGLHPNVARTHLDTLAKADLVVTGRRKHAGGGRPAKVYVAREQAQSPGAGKVPTGGQLAVAVALQALSAVPDAQDLVHDRALAQGRKLVTAAGGRADRRDFEAAAVVAVEAHRAAFPEARLVSDGEHAVHVDGLEVGLRSVGDVDGPIGDAIAKGLVRGAFEAAGSIVRVRAAGGRVRAVVDVAGEAAATMPAASVDARGQTYQAGVVMTMRAMVSLAPNEELEVLTDTQGAPSAFARWADRAGHPVVDVARVRDLKGSEAVRLLLRKSGKAS
ncbi:MAG: putative ArsR family transcriptional regulator/TusA-related sulfurtransferase [Glaciecola sp.]|jgi:predicted ArsR family transcriptional regulator/TusA-related sulfurtransferase